MGVEKKKIGIFTGAGAEVSYGMPNGGEFALDLFREPIEKPKDEFKKRLDMIDETSQYSTSMFPEDFKSRKITVFNKKSYESLIEGSLENKRDSIYDYLDNFDSRVENIINRTNKYDSLDDVFRELTGKTIMGTNYSGAIELDKKLTTNNKLFSSNYFSAFFKLVELEKATDSLLKIILAILELFIGSNGYELVSSLNDGVFSKRPPKLSFVDELGGFFALNYSNCGRLGLELVLDRSIIKCRSELSIGIFEELGSEILNDIYSCILDYQSLIDSNYRYIYSPEKNWGKFTKITVFLYTVRQYLLKCIDKIDGSKDGYYDDIAEVSQNYEITAIGTTNYTNLISDKLKTYAKIYKLNGSIDDFYDPYLNTIIHKDSVDQYDKFLVPLLFTQSGIKPITSINMSKRYVEMYDRFMASDKICVIGFGFNQDDGHINGLFRSLIDQENKQVVILDYVDKSSVTKRERKNHYISKLRIENTDNLEIIMVNRKREEVESNKKWIYIFQGLFE